MIGYSKPPAVGDEADTLLGALERMRATFAGKCADLLREAIDGRTGEDPPGPATPFSLGAT